MTGCTGTSTGYSCSGTDSPTATNAALECSTGTPGNNGATDYCCFTNASSACAQDPTVTGCTGNSYGFSCSGTSTPAQANAALTCSTGTAGNSGLTLYCCH